MIKILVVVPYEELNEQVRRYFGALDSIAYCFEVLTGIPAEKLALAAATGDFSLIRTMA